MILNSKELDISGVKLFDLKLYNDERGSFSEVFLTKSVYKEFNINYVQENVWKLLEECVKELKVGWEDEKVPQVIKYIARVDSFSQFFSA